MKNKLDDILAAMALHLLARLIIYYSLRRPVALITVRTTIPYTKWKREEANEVKNKRVRPILT